MIWYFCVTKSLRSSILSSTIDGLIRPPLYSFNGDSVAMKRRQVFRYVAGIAALSIVQPVAAKEYIDFTPDVYAKALESGQPFMLAFLSDW